jgi:hypothetical protein
MGVPYCELHETERLSSLVRDGIRYVTFDEQGRPTSQQWLGWFVRLVDTVRLSGAPRRGRIRNDATNFKFEAEKVVFQIDRHPVGRVTSQSWEFDLGSHELRLLSEALIESEFSQSPEGDFQCPECKSPLSVTPGRAKCEACGFMMLHDHTPY